MKLLVDHNISPYLARAVHVVVAPDGHEVHAVADKFGPAAPDIDWISALGREGDWAFLSGDHRIRKNPAEREALRRARLTGFFLAPNWQKMKTAEKTGRLLLKWQTLVDQEKLVTGGALFEVRVRGKLCSLPL